MIAVNEDYPIQPHILQGMTRLHMKDEKEEKVMRTDGILQRAGRLTVKGKYHIKLKMALDHTCKKNCNDMCYI